MTYCTQQDMIDRFGSEDLIQLTDRAELGQIDTTALGAAINDATGAIDVYLSSRHTLPLAQVPIWLKRLCCDIARYYLYGGDAPDSVADRYNAAVELLQSVAKGDFDPKVGDVSGDGGVAFKAGTTVFDELQDWP